MAQGRMRARAIHLGVVLAAGLAAPSVGHAQTEPSPPTSSPPPVEEPAASGDATAPSAPQAPESSPQLSPVPAAAVLPPPLRVQREVSAATPVSTDLVLEIDMQSFLSSLSGGFFLGGRGGGQTIWGAGLWLSSQKLGNSSAVVGLTFAPGARFVLASASEGRVDLVGEVDVGFSKYYASEGRSTAVSDGSALWADAGPALRYWITPSLAISYATLLDVSQRFGREAFIPGDVTSPVVVDGMERRSATSTTLWFRGQFSVVGVF